MKRISDANGRLLIDITDEDCDGSHDFCTVYTYDSDGNEMPQFQDEGCDGSVEWWG